MLLAFMVSAVAFWQCRGTAEPTDSPEVPEHSESEHP